MKTLSNLSKVIIAILAILFIAIIQHYYLTNINSHRIPLNELSQNPSKYEGQEEEAEGRILSTDKDSFVLITPSHKIMIFNNHPNLKKGDYGTFLLKVENGKIINKEYRLYNKEPIKYFLSLLAIIIVIIIFLKEFKLTKRGFKHA